MKDTTWHTDDRVYRYTAGVKKFGKVESVSPCPFSFGNPWITVRYDDGGLTSGAQRTLMEDGINREE